MNQPVVFVIDDDESICRSLRRLIQSVGLHVRTFTSGNDFLSQGCQNVPGCLVLDVRMPEIDGLEIQQRLADSGSTMPIIFMSAHEDDAIRRQAFNSGAVAFLHKPFEDQVFIETVNAALSKFTNE
jgi:FixJ family two-component response regulator